MDLVEARKKAKKLGEKTESGPQPEPEQKTAAPEQVEAKKPEPKKARKPKASKPQEKIVEQPGPERGEEKQPEAAKHSAEPEERPQEKPREPEKPKAGGEEEVFVDMNFGEDLPGAGDFEPEMVLEKAKPGPRPEARPDPKAELKKEVEFMKEIAKETLAPPKPAPAPKQAAPAPAPQAKAAPVMSQDEVDKDFNDLVVEDLVQYGYGRAEAEANLVEFLSFRLGSEIYAVPLIRIQQIIKPRPVTLVPGAPEYILGIISLRGMVIPVFDLRRRLGLEPAEPTRQSRIIIVKLDEQGLMSGLLVDQVKEVARVPGDSIEPTPAIFSDIEGEFLEGIARFKGQMLIVLRLSHVIVGKKEEGKGQ
jgi:purine-binding chemotaxis protein CheW